MARTKISGAAAHGPWRLLIAACLALLALNVAGTLVYRHLTDPVLRTIALDIAPTDIVVDNHSGHVFVAGETTTGPAPVVVDMLDARTGDLLRRTWPVTGVEAWVGAMALAPQAGRLYVVIASSDGGFKAVCALDTRSGRLLRRVDLPVGGAGANPSVAVDERVGRVVVQGAPGQVATFDLPSGRVLHTAPFPYNDLLAVGAVADEGSSHVFVHALSDTAGHSSVLMLDARAGRLLRRVPLPDSPPRGSPRRRAGDAFVSTLFDAAWFDLGPEIVDASRTGRIFLSGYPGILVLDARTGARVRSITATPGPLALDEATARVFAVGHMPSPLRPPTADGDVVRMLDARSGRVLRTVAISPDSDARALAVDERRHRLFLASPLDRFHPGTIVALDTRTGNILKAIIGHGGLKVGVDERTGHLFALVPGGVTILDPAR